MKLILCLLMIWSENAIARNDVRVIKYEKAPFDGILVSEPDYREDALNKILLEDCQNKMDKLSSEDRQCLECEYTFIDEVKGFFIGLVVGGAVVSIIALGKK